MTLVRVQTTLVLVMSHVAIGLLLKAFWCATDNLYRNISLTLLNSKYVIPCLQLIVQLLVTSSVTQKQSALEYCARLYLCLYL